MNSPVLIGISAGFVSAVLSASAAVGSLLAFMLFYLAPLPVFLAGLGWGVQTAALAAISGTAIFSFALGFKAGMTFFLSLGLPVCILCHLTLLNRPIQTTTSQGEPITTEDSQSNQAVEWYPIGRILGWSAIMAGTLASLSVLLFGSDLETYKTTLNKLLDQVILKELQSSSPQQITKEQFEKFKPTVMQALPAASAIIWLGISILNLWLSARVVEISGRLARPRPILSEIDLPQQLGIGLIVSILVSFSPGLPGIMATGFAGAILFVYLLYGLIIIHTITLNLNFRFVMLFFLYFGILRFGWLALIVAMIGMGEPFFRLRERANSNAPPPQNPGS